MKASTRRPVRSIEIIADLGRATDGRRHSIGRASELKDAELLRERIALANDVRDYVGKYFSVKFVRQSILKQSEREIEQIDNQIKKEIDDGLIAAPQTSVPDDNDIM